MRVEDAHEECDAFMLPIKKNDQNIIILKIPPPLKKPKLYLKTVLLFGREQQRHSIHTLHLLYMCIVY